MAVGSVSVVNNACSYPFSSVSLSGLGHIISTNAEPAEPNALSFNETMFQGVAPGNVSFTVRLERTTDIAVQFSFETSDETAISGLDYTLVNTIFTIPPGSQFHVVEVQLLLRSDVTPDLTFAVAINNVSSAQGLALRQGAALFKIAEAGAVVLTEGESYVMEVECSSKIQVPGVQMNLESGSAPDCERDCALGSIDYVYAQYLVEWVATAEGFVVTGARSNNFTVQTVVNPTTMSTLTFAVHAVSIEPATIHYDAASYFTKNITIVAKSTPPRVTNWNCPPPFKYKGPRSELTMYLQKTNVATQKYGKILPVVQNLNGCFSSQNSVTYTAYANDASKPMTVTNGVLHCDFKAEGKGRILYISATDTKTNATSTFETTLKLIVARSKDIAALQATIGERERSVFDLYTYQLSVPKSYITYDDCKRVDGINRVILAGYPDCCTTQKVLGGNRTTYPAGVSNVEIVFCYLLPVKSHYTFDLVFNVKAIRPGKSTVCVGQAVTNPVNQCFELFSYGVQTVNWIPNQYVSTALNGTWALSLPITVSGMRTDKYTLEFMTSENVTATGEQDSWSMVNMVGTTAGMFQVTVLSRALAGGAISSTKGVTFWVFAFNF